MTQMLGEEGAPSWTHLLLSGRKGQGSRRQGSGNPQETTKKPGAWEGAAGTRLLRGNSAGPPGDNHRGAADCRSTRPGRARGRPVVPPGGRGSHHWIHLKFSGHKRRVGGAQQKAPAIRLF